MTQTTRSADGSLIAYEKSGSGPPLVLVDGALCHRTSGPSRPLAARLAGAFTVYTYDRRGRGESGDTAPYAPEREAEDLVAVIEAAGGHADVYGISSGAALALDAAAAGAGIRRLALYEAPFVVDATLAPLPEEWIPTLEAALAEGRRGAAVGQFMRRVGVPGPFIALMHVLPAWRKLCAVAHTLPYDFAVLGDTQTGNPLPAERWAAVSAPAAVLVGSKSPAWMQNGMHALARTLGAHHETLPGQTHMVKPDVLAPVLEAFYAQPQPVATRA
jgi:pimeloyl-ACP methyl ester carboxylesterase